MAKLIETRDTTDFTIHIIKFNEDTLNSITNTIDDKYSNGVEKKRVFNKPAANRIIAVFKNHGYQVRNPDSYTLSFSDITPVTEDNVSMKVNPPFNYPLAVFNFPGVFDKDKQNAIAFYVRKGNEKYEKDSEIIRTEIISELQKLRTSVSSSDYLGGKKRRKTKKSRSGKNKKTRKH